MPHIKGWTSPRLGIRFALGGETLEIFGPAGQPFLSTIERAARLRETALRADQERERADQERQRADRLAERLRALGLEP